MIPPKPDNQSRSSWYMQLSPSNSDALSLMSSSSEQEEYANFHQPLAPPQATADQFVFPLEFLAGDIVHHFREGGSLDP
eukprot:GSA25T00026198001.1